MWQDEFEMNMRLIGAPTMADVVPSMVDTHALFTPGPEATMYDANCEFPSCQPPVCPLSLANMVGRWRYGVQRGREADV
jgi:hypothetical protein